MPSCEEWDAFSIDRRTQGGTTGQHVTLGICIYFKNNCVSGNELFDFSQFNFGPRDDPDSLCLVWTADNNPMP